MVRNSFLKFRCVTAGEVQGQPQNKPVTSESQDLICCDCIAIHRHERIIAERVQKGPGYWSVPRKNVVTLVKVRWLDAGGFVLSSVHFRPDAERLVVSRAN